MRNNRYKGGFPVDKLDGRSGVFTTDDIDALKRKSLSTWPAPNQNDTSQDVWPSGPDRDPYYSQVVWHLTDAIETEASNAMHDHSGKGHDAHFIKPRNDWPYGSPFHAGPNHFHSTYFHDSCYRVTDTASLRLGTTAFTIEFWACLHRNDSTEHYIMGKGGQSGRTSGTGWVVYLTSTYILGYYDAVGNVSIQGATSLNRDQWYHVAIVRSSTSANDTRIYVDGALYATGTSSGNFTDTNTLYIGRDRVDTSSSAYTGKLTDIRISSGAVYIAPFTRPSTPLTMASPALLTIGAIEPWHPNSSLWQREGLTISLNASQVMRLNDTPFMNKTTNPYLGRGFHSVAMLDGTWFRLKDYTAGGLNYLNFGTGPFTVEAWVRMGDARGYFPLCGKGTGNAGAAGATGWSAYIDGNFRPVWSDGATQHTGNTNEHKIYHSGWYHIAYVRESTATNGFKIYVNGYLAYTGTCSTNYTDTNDVNMFATRNVELAAAASAMCCLKISKTARYTSAFSINPQSNGVSTFINNVCTTTNDANTSFLSFGAGNLTREIPMDGGWINDGYGQYSFRDVQGHQYFGEKHITSRTSTTTPANYGGHSSYFYNSGQVVVKARTTTGDFSFGTGDFSIEFFVTSNWRNSEGNSYIVTFFDTRNFFNDAGIVLQSGDGLRGFEVITNNTMVLTTNRGLWGDTRKWTHVVVQRTNGSIALYVNGKKEAESRFTSSIDAPQNRIHIGNGSYINLRYANGFWGHISNFRIVKGVSAYGAYSGGVGVNPSSIVVPTKPMDITANTVFYSLCNSTLRDETGRNDVVAGGWNNLNENLTSGWDVYSGTTYNPFDPETDFPTFYDTQFMGSNQYPGWNNGMHANLPETTNNNSFAPTLGWIPRMSRAWTIEQYFYVHETNPGAPGSQGQHQCADSNGHSGWNFSYHLNNAATPAASRNDVSFRMYLGTTNYQQLATSGNTGNLQPHSWNHVAIQYDPTRTNKMAMFVNGRRVAQQTTAFSQSTRADITYHLRQYNGTGPMRISDIARYNNDSTTITVPKGKWLYDSNTYILSYATAPILDSSNRAYYYLYGAIPDSQHKKFGKASIKFPNDATNTTHVCRIGSDEPWWGTRHKDVRREDLTFECWASWHDLATGGSNFMSTAEGACLFHYNNALWVGINPAGYWQILVRGSNTTYSTFTSGVQVALRSSGNMDFVAVCRSGKNWILWINGVQQAICMSNNQGTYASNGPPTTANGTLSLNHDWDMYTWSNLMLGADYYANQSSKWCGNMQDFRYTQNISRYATRVINGVATMCHNGTDIPALPTKPFPTR